MLLKFYNAQNSHNRVLCGPKYQVSRLRNSLFTDKEKKKATAETDSNFSNHWEFQIMIIHPTKAACISDYPQVTLFCNLATFQAGYLVSEDSVEVLEKTTLPKGRSQIPKPVSEMINGSKYRKKHWD